MNKKITNSNEFYAGRLSQIHMAAHERLRAEAHLARAEAIADMLFAIANGFTRLLKALLARDVRHPAGHPSVSST